MDISDSLQYMNSSYGGSKLTNWTGPVSFTTCPALLEIFKVCYWILTPKSKRDAVIHYFPSIPFIDI